MPYGPAAALLAAGPAHASPRLSADEKTYLRKFYDDDNSRRFSYDYFKKTHGQLLEAVNEGWPAKKLQAEYGSTDHLTRACFEADVHRFGYGKTQYQVLQLNQLVKDSKDFASFKAEASKLLSNLNERFLRTEFDTAKATSVSTANALRAIADGAAFARYKATQDKRTRPYHASLHNRVFDMSKPGWERFIPPLGWNCRCHIVYEDDHDGPVTTPAEAEDLLTSDEVARLQKDGFLLNRIDKKQLFSQKQNYLNGLQDPEQIALSIGKLKYSDQGQERWANLDKSQLSAYALPDKSKQDVLDDFAATAVNKVKTYTDYAGRPIFQTEKDLLNHLKPKYLASDENRQKHYFTISDTLTEPDEVYFFDKSVDAQQGNPAGPHAKLSYAYLKFYDDDTVLAAVVEFDDDLPQMLRTWYQVKDASRIDEARRGLLIHKK